MIAVDLTPTIDRMSEDLTGTRHDAPTITDGRRAAGSTSPLSFRGVVQPMSGEELRREVPGTRADAGIRIWTDTELRTVDASSGTPPDDVVWNGDTYQVVQVDRRQPLGNFWRVTATRRGL